MKRHKKKLPSFNRTTLYEGIPITRGDLRKEGLLVVFKAPLRLLGGFCAKGVHALDRFFDATSVTLASRPSLLSIPKREYLLFPLLSGILAIFFILLPSFFYFSGIKSTAIMNAEAGISNLSAWISDMEEGKYENAHEQLQYAATNFGAAIDTLHSIHGILRAAAPAIPLKGKEFSDRKRLLDAAHELPPLLADGASLYERIKGKEFEHLDEILLFLTTHRERIQRITHAIGAVSSESVGGKRRESLWHIKKIAAAAEQSLPAIEEALDAMTYIMGFEHKRRYLFVLQNPAELRPTGGFIGTIALADVNRGMLASLSVPGGGPYDLSGSLTERIIAPRPLHRVTYSWKFHDANWFSDFPTSAKKLAWFYERSGGSSVDGIIAVNASIIKELLQLTGPIDLPAYKKTITSENFMDETQRAVQLEYDKTKNRPKQFLADMAPLFLEKMSMVARQDPSAVLAALLNGVWSRDIQFFFFEARASALAASYGADGRMINTDGDYLSVVDANVGGDKSDSVTTRDISYSIRTASDGTLHATLSITRNNNGTKSDIFVSPTQWEYVRAYVPNGSALISAEGFERPDQDSFKKPLPYHHEDETLAEIEGAVRYDTRSGTKLSSEFGKTVFGNWMRVPRGESRTATLIYRLPTSLAKDLKEGSYRLLVQRQSGSGTTSFAFHTDIGEGRLLSWAHPLAVHLTPEGVVWSARDLREDVSIAFTLLSKSP